MVREPTEPEPEWTPAECERVARRVVQILRVEDLREQLRMRLAEEMRKDAKVFKYMYEWVSS